METIDEFLGRLTSQESIYDDNGEDAIMFKNSLFCLSKELEENVKYPNIGDTPMHDGFQKYLDENPKLKVDHNISPFGSKIKGVYCESTALVDETIFDMLPSDLINNIIRVDESEMSCALPERSEDFDEFLYAGNKSVSLKTAKELVKPLDTCGIDSTQESPSQGKVSDVRQMGGLSTTGNQFSKNIPQPPEMRFTLSYGEPSAKSNEIEGKISCEWKLCSFVCTNVKYLVEHIGEHTNHRRIRSNEGGESFYTCRWMNCEARIESREEMTRHLYFHAYHKHLSHKGSWIIRRSRGPLCKILGTKFSFPDLKTPFECSWENCVQKFDNPFVYFSHVNKHAWNHPRDLSGVDCRWRGCSSRLRNVYKLKEHVKTHTREKKAGCPRCGVLFANNSKLLDHCKRQQIPTTEMKENQCLLCLKVYPSPEILRNHVKNHVCRQRCGFCGKMCVNATTLAQHVRYRHQDGRPYRCDRCSHACKSRHDLKKHVLCHQRREGSVSLPRPRGKHRRADKSMSLFSCHLCSKRYRRGSLLSVHLRKQHGIEKPSDMSRLTYRKEDDGFFRLVREDFVCVFEVGSTGESLEYGEEGSRSRAECPTKQVHPGTPKYDELYTRGTTPLLKNGPWRANKKKSSSVYDIREINETISLSCKKSKNVSVRRTERSLLSSL